MAIEKTNDRISSEEDAELRKNCKHWNGQITCPRCNTLEGVHGGCSCGYLSAKGGGEPVYATPKPTTLNPYKAWNEANECLKEINQILGALNIVMRDLEIPTLSKLVIQGHLIQVLEATRKYMESVKPMLDEYNATRPTDA